MLWAEIDVKSGPESFSDAAEGWHALIYGLDDALDNEEISLHTAMELAHSDYSKAIAARDAALLQTSSGREVSIDIALDRLERAELMLLKISSVSAAAGNRKLALEEGKLFLGEIDLCGGPEGFSDAARKWRAMLNGLLTALEDEQMDVQVPIELAHSEVSKAAVAQLSRHDVSTARGLARDADAEHVSLDAIDTSELARRYAGLRRARDSVRLARDSVGLAEAEYNDAIEAWAELAEPASGAPRRKKKKIPDFHLN